MYPTPPEGDPPKEDSPFRCVHSLGFPHLLEQLGISLLVTSYQAGKLMAVRSLEGRINTLLRSFPGPMGLAVEGLRRVALGTRNQVWFFQNATDIAPRLEPPARCLLSAATGVRHRQYSRPRDRLASSELWLVNTLFSCLCTLEPNYSFVPRWRPPFISGLAGEDRCHAGPLGADGIDAGASGVVPFRLSLVPAGQRDRRLGPDSDRAAGAISQQGDSPADIADADGGCEGLDRSVVELRQSLTSQRIIRDSHRAAILLASIARRSVIVQGW